VENAAADFLIKYPGIAHVFTRTQLTNSQLPPTLLGQQVARAWHRQFSGDLLLIQKPFWYLFGKPFLYGSTHGSAYAYDTHVPLTFMGKQFRPGKYSTQVGIVDIAPTLSHILNVRPPSGNEGRVLSEALQ
jgi:predicted AlkP superfamily pyrophosphatase or phosphodiesterase